MPWFGDYIIIMMAALTRKLQNWCNFWEMILKPGRKRLQQCQFIGLDKELSNGYLAIIEWDWVSSEELLAKADNTLWDLHNSSDDTKAQ